MQSCTVKQETGVFFYSLSTHIYMPVNNENEHTDRWRKNTYSWICEDSKTLKSVKHYCRYTNATAPEISSGKRVFYSSLPKQEIPLRVFNL